MRSLICFQSYPDRVRRSEQKFRRVSGGKESRAESLVRGNLESRGVAPLKEGELESQYLRRLLGKADRD